MIELRERDFSGFFEAPFRAYGAGCPYVSPLRSDLARFLDEKRNPLFRHFGRLTYFTAYRGGRPVGRITAHVHTASNRRHAWRRSYFGFFDCAADEAAARALLEAAERWGRTQGCEEILGNFNLTAMQPIGVMTEGFENAPYSDQLYSPPHIPGLLERCGYRPTFPMTCFEIDLLAAEPDGVLHGSHRKLLAERRYRWEHVRRSRLPRQLEEIRDLLNDGFVQNPMFVPLTAEEFRFQAKDLSLVIDERITWLAYEDDRPIATLVCVPDLNPFLRATESRLGLLAPFHLLTYRRRCDRAVVVFQSVRQGMQRRGLGAVLFAKTVRALKDAGYRRLGTTWVSDENIASIKTVMRFPFRPLHRLNLFGKSLL